MQISKSSEVESGIKSSRKSRYESERLNTTDNSSTKKLDKKEKNGHIENCEASFTEFSECKKKEYKALKNTISRDLAKSMDNKEK